MSSFPSWVILDPMLHSWLLEDLGRGDRTTQHLFSEPPPTVEAIWITKQKGILAGLPLAQRIFYLLNPNVQFTSNFQDGYACSPGEQVAYIKGPADALLSGERVALNLVMRLSGIATLTQEYSKAIEHLPTKLVDTRKTTPGLRVLEKYATRIGKGINHRFGLDDAIMLKDNHIYAVGGITQAIRLVRQSHPYPLTIEVETSNLSEVSTAIQENVDIIMLDNMTIPHMLQAVKLIRENNSRTKIEASGNITLDTIVEVASTGVDYISTSAPITRSSWLDISMRLYK